MQRYTKLARCTYIRSQVFALKNSIEVDANEFKNLIHSEDVWKPYLTKILSCLNLSYLILSYFILAELHLYDPEGETSRKITNNIHFHIVSLTCMIPRVRPAERSRTASTFTLYFGNHDSTGTNEKSRDNKLNPEQHLPTLFESREGSEVLVGLPSSRKKSIS